MNNTNLYVNDLIHRFPGHTFTETSVGDFTIVSFKDTNSVIISEAKSMAVIDAYRRIRNNVLDTARPVFMSTTTQRDAIRGILDGITILNITTNRTEIYHNGNWISTGGTTTGAWSRNSENGLLFPTTLTDKIGIGTVTPAYPLDVTGTLRSSRYLLGTGPDLSLIPIVGEQSVVTAFWGLQLVGNRQVNVDYNPSNVEARDFASVIIPNQQASKIAVAIRGAANQTGDLLRLQNFDAIVLSRFDSAGRLGIGIIPTVALDVVGGGKFTGDVTLIGAATDLVTARGGKLRLIGSDIEQTYITSFLPDTLVLRVGGENGLRAEKKGEYVNTIFGQSRFLEINSTDGFAYMPAGAGKPTGIPTNYTGKVPFYYDLVGRTIWIYSGARWNGVDLPLT